MRESQHVESNFINEILGSSPNMTGSHYKIATCSGSTQAPSSRTAIDSICMDARNAEIVWNNNCQSNAEHLHPSRRVSKANKSEAFIYPINITAKITDLVSLLPRLAYKPVSTQKISYFFLINLVWLVSLNYEMNLAGHPIF